MKNTLNNSTIGVGKYKHKQLWWDLSFRKNILWPSTLLSNMSKNWMCSVLLYTRRVWLTHSRMDSLGGRIRILGLPFN